MPYLSIRPPIYPPGTVVYVFAIAVLRGPVSEAHVIGSKKKLPIRPTVFCLPALPVSLFKSFPFCVHQDLVHVHISLQHPPELLTPAT